MATIIRDVLREFEAKARAWEADVASMRAKSLVNPPADTLEYAAKDLLQLVRTVSTATQKLTPKQYAALHGGSEQTVRRWCDRGELPGARRNAKREWEIPADAVRAPRARRDRERKSA